MSALYLPGVDNTLADALSWETVLAPEWILDQLVFHQFQSPDLPPQIDLCESQCNAKTPRFLACLDQTEVGGMGGQASI